MAIDEELPVRPARPKTVRKRDERKHDDDVELGVMTRVGKALAVLFGVHLQFAQKEASEDLGRVIAGVVCLVIAVVFVLFALALAQAGAVIYVHKYRLLSYRASFLAVAGCDCSLALLSLLIARAKLRKPFLKQTRGLVRKTVTALTE